MLYTKSIGETVLLFTPPTLDPDELRVLAEIDEARRSLAYMLRQPRRWTGVLRRVTLARAIRGSNTIEGYTVDLDQALAAVEGATELDADRETTQAIAGYREAMTYVLQLADDPHYRLTVDLIRSLHFIMTGYALDRLPGRWRPGLVYVRDDRSGDMVYEAPDPDLVPSLMQGLVDQVEGDEGHAIVRAAMAHLNLVMIHPFKDGNGRMARCLQTLVLARGMIVDAEFSSIEEYLGANTEAYYRILAEVGQGAWHPENDARPWLRFCLTAHHRQAQTLRRRVREIERMWSRLEEVIAQRHLPDRTIFALYDAAAGFSVTNSRYRANADVSEWVASRDMRLLVDAGALEAQGEKRGRRYIATEWLRGIRNELRESRPAIADPFVSP